MNKTYRNVWNAATQTWTAAAETATRKRKGSCRVSIATCILAGALIGSVSTSAIADDQISSDATLTCEAGYVADGATCVATRTSGSAEAKSMSTTSSGIGIMLGANAYQAGPGATADGAQSVAIGNNTATAATAGASTALGTNSTASASYGVAIGGATQAGRGAIVTSGATGSIAIGTISSASARNSVALGMGSVADRENTVSVGAGVPNIDGSTFTRQIVNVSAGTQDTDAVNVGQMNAGLSTTNASIAATNSALSTTNASLARTNTTLSTTNTTLAATNTALSTTNSQVASLEGGLSTANTNIATHTTEITTLNDKLNELSSGTVGLVQQAAAGDNITVGANTDGGAVNFAGTAGARKLSGIADGTADADAVNVGQMNAGLSTTNAAIAATNAELSTTNTTLAATNTALSTTNSQVASLEGGLSSANTNIATHTSDISTINDKLGELSSGTLGLVQQAAAGADLTVGANTDGGAVNFAGTAGARKLTGVAAGDISATSTEAVNGAQLHGVSDSVASAIGGGASVNPDGSISAPSFTVGDGSGGTKVVNSVGDVVTNIDGRVTSNEGDIKKLADDIGSGTLGLVQQANPGDDITVGANTDGNAVNFAGTAGARKLTGVAAGDVSASSTEAVNGAQLHGVSDSVASAIGGGAIVNPDGSISAPSFTVGDGSGGTKIVNSVGDVVTNIDGRVTSNEGDIKKLADDIGSGTLGLVQQANPGDDITVGANTDGGAVNFAGTAGARKLTGVAAGDISAASTDAVNGSQLHGVSDSVASAIGGGASVNPDGSVSAPSFTVGDGSGGTKVVNSVGDVVTNIDGRVTNNEGDIKDLSEQLGSGTVGLVQQAAKGDDITVGANTDGRAVDFTGTAGARKLTGIAAGDVSATSNEAVNGSQLHGVSNSVASAIGGGASVNPDGSISAPSFSVGDGSGGTKIVNSVGDVVTNIDGRVTNNEGDIKKLADDLGSGTVGLVQQANPADDITVGANTGGNAVNFSSKTGARKLTGIAAGDVSATSTEAVNGSQLHGVSDSVASAIGGGASVNPDGSISAPSFTVGDGSGGTRIVNSVGDVVTNLDGRVTSNEGGIKKLSEQLESGELGLVQQNPSTGMITVGATTGGTSVNFAGTGGARVLSGVANGVGDDDVVTVSQLRATGLIDYTGKEVGAVTYDSGLNFDTVTFAGTFGTKLQRVAAGEISATSMDAVNGSQLFDLQEQFAKQYGDLSGQLGDLSSRFGDLSDRLGDLEANPGTGGPGTGDGSTVVGEGAVASGENSSAIGQGSLASGENASAVGQGAVASGNNGSAIGQGSVASGENGSALGQGAVASGENGTALGQGSAASGSNGTAVGQGAVASGENSTSLGQGASATGNGSVAIGQGSVATEANTVSFGNGTEEGNRRLVNIADGINASDAATKGQLDRAMESVDARFNDTNRAINDVAKNAYAGIAAAMAMPNMTPSQPGKTVVAVGAANFKSGSAIAAGATYRSRNGNWLVNGATSITSVGDVGVRAQVGYEF
ncbi:YadA-like family protein [Burkholderia sp. BCC0397]|uniref:YadA-like family protein n=1 Tax=Burkholderia sp. BCC0397 TaxID=486876 RepID=UPI00158C292C|nr:YadA-like family protein [Burkholderia sp. BCC0397]